MSNHRAIFGGHCLMLPFDLDARLTQWDALRATMIKNVPAAFTRDEWAYLIQFVSRDHLLSVFTETFGERDCGSVTTLCRARDPIAIWLPNNVSLLGPLVLILASLTGSAIRVKAGSNSVNLCGAFVDYLLEHLQPGDLRAAIRDGVRIEQFDRRDPRNAEMSASARARIAFGSDQAIAAIEAMPHPAGSVAIGFGDRRSEAWVESSALDDDAITTIVKVFAIYGTAGCTSPRRLVILDGTPPDCEALRARLLAVWPTIVRQDVPAHVASSNVLHQQLNAANGWDVRLAPRNSAVIAVGTAAHAPISGLMSLAIVPATVAESIAALPANIQTIGYVLRDPSSLYHRIAGTAIKRFVPVGQMHHFGPVWDGANFWRQLFEEVAVRA